MHIYRGLDIYAYFLDRTVYARERPCSFAFPWTAQKTGNGITVGQRWIYDDCKLYFKPFLHI